MTLLKQLPLPRRILLLLSLLRTGSLGQTGVPICYFPNHEFANVNGYDNYACDLSLNVSACCGVGVVCLSNGLCQSGTNEVIRGSCTDQTWRSPDCPQYCLDASTGGTDLISCQNVTNNALDYCCDHTNMCCDTGVGRFRLQASGTPITTIGAGASTATRQPATSTSPSSSSFTSSASPSSNASFSNSTSSTPSLGAPQSGLSTVAKAGIGIGVAGTVIIAALLAYLAWRRRRSVVNSVKGHSGESKILSKLPAENAGLHEMSGERQIELQVGNPAWELEGEHAMGSRRSSAH